jgi:tyrosyl-tRNA synthetase
MKPTIFPNTEKIDFSKKLRVKFGIDPTSDKLHLGHMMAIFEAKKLWEQGHHVDIVLGTFTAQLGDPSGKDTMRPILNADETEKNAESIIEQVARIFGNPDSSHPNFKNIQIHKNGEWFGVMNVIMMTNILSKFTTTQLLSRDSFQKRMDEKNPIGMHELIVPILQGYDSVHLDTDVEIGGTDQLFNFAITRDVQREKGRKPEVCILMPILNGTDGRKMSKSFDNCIFINDAPNDVFGKTMSISDALMKEWWSIFIGDKLLMGIDKHPMEMKKELAFHITDIVWPSNKSEIANEAQTHFENIIQKRNVPEIFFDVTGESLITVITQVRNCSISEAKRLIAQGGIKINDTKITDEKFGLKSGDIVKVGKLDFAKVI